MPVLKSSASFLFFHFRFFVLLKKSCLTTNAKSIAGTPQRNRVQTVGPLNVRIQSLFQGYTTRYLVVFFNFIHFFSPQTHAFGLYRYLLIGFRLGQDHICKTPCEDQTQTYMTLNKQWKLYSSSSCLLGKGAFTFDYCKCSSSSEGWFCMTQFSFSFHF